MRKILLLPITLCLILAACGSDGGSDDAATTRSSSTSSSSSDAAGSAEQQARAAGLTGEINAHGTAKVSDGGSIDVEMDDTYFKPSFIEAPPGAKFTVELENEGELDHTFTVDSLKIDDQVAPGKKAEVEVTMPTAASPFHCDFHGGMGMQGALIATGAGAKAPSSDATTTTASSDSGGGY